MIPLACEKSADFDAEKALKLLATSGETAAIIGHIEPHSGEDQVVILK